MALKGGAGQGHVEEEENRESDNSGLIRYLGRLQQTAIDTIAALGIHAQSEAEGLPMQLLKAQLLFRTCDVCNGALLEVLETNKARLVIGGYEVVQVFEVQGELPKGLPNSIASIHEAAQPGLDAEAGHQWVRLQTAIGLVFDVDLLLPVFVGGAFDKCPSLIWPSALRPDDGSSQLTTCVPGLLYHVAQDGRQRSLEARALEETALAAAFACAKQRQFEESSLFDEFVRKHEQRFGCEVRRRGWRQILVAAMLQVQDQVQVQVQVHAEAPTAVGTLYVRFLSNREVNDEQGNQMLMGLVTGNGSYR
jgi:hypothetical protein